MNGVYVANYNLNDASGGVVKKIKAQISLFEKFGYTVRTFDLNDLLCTPDKLPKKVIRAFAGNSGSEMHELFDKMYDYIESNTCEFVYIRKSFLDKYQIEILKKIKEQYPKIKIILEIPTYPYDNEVKFYKKPLLWCDQRARENAKECIDRIVTFSGDNEIFGIPTIEIENGIDYGSVPKREPKKHAGINLTAVSFFAHWHGYDRMIKGMLNESEIVQKENLHFYMVGDGRRTLKKYRKMIDNSTIMNHFHFCGKKSGRELNRIYDITDIGLDSMGRHRVNVFYNSTLKGKEYCAYGVPIISGVKTELDFVEDYPYYKRVPADDSPISIGEVVKFYEQVYGNKTAEEVSWNIRNRTEKMFDFKHTFSKVMDYIEGNN